MKETTMNNNTSTSGCWECLMSLLQASKPTGLGDSLRLTSVAEELSRRASATTQSVQRKR